MEIPVFKEINDLHEALRSPVRTADATLHIFRAEETNSGIRTYMPMHRNMFYEIGLITQAQVETSLNDTAYNINKPHVYCAAEGQLRKWRREGNWQGILCMFKPEQINWGLLNRNVEKKFGFFLRSNPKVLLLSDETAECLQVLFEQMCGVYEKNARRKNELVLAYLQTILLAIQEEMNRQTHGEQLDKPSDRGEELVMRFKLMVEKQGAYYQNLDDYANALCVSKKHLEKTVDKYLGQSAGTLIRDSVVYEARTLLLQTDLPIREIAYQLGFNDPQYFNKYFKRYTGFTPSTYRKKHLFNP